MWSHILCLLHVLLKMVDSFNRYSIVDIGYVTDLHKDSIHCKVNSVQEACAKCFEVHLLKFEILQIT